MKKWIRTILLLSLLTTVFAGCSSSTTTKTTNSTPTTASSDIINIVNFSFTPSTLTAPVGTTVTWKNNDGTTHTVTSNTGVFDSGDLSPQATFSHTFNNSGTFPYHCSIHTYMTGTIIVQ
jgi:plastocyanin